MAEKNYTEDDIKVITARESVRLRPKMYFEKCFRDQSLDVLPLEVACHALDEYINGKCTRLEIVLSEDSFVVKYDTGMSLGTGHGAHTAELLMTSLFAGRNHKKHPEVGKGFCELDIASINYVSAFCALTTVSKGKKGNFRFEEGVIKHRHITEASTETEHTEIVIHPDKTIFGELKFTYEGVSEKVKQLNAKLEGLTIGVSKRSD
jgi:DNA gyrase/topoisomerase IV subunit B